MLWRCRPGTSDIDVSDATNASDSLALITSAIEQVAGISCLPCSAKSLGVYRI